MSPSQDEAVKRFIEALTSDEMKDEMKVVWECVIGGLADYEDPTLYGPAAKRDHTAAVSAACRNAHIVARAKRAAVEAPDAIQIRRKRGRVTFIVKNRTEVWFKKLNDRGEPSFRPSLQALEFVQTPIKQSVLQMEQPPEVNRVIGGYRLNGTSTDFTVVISRPVGDGNYAHVELQAREVVDLFVEPAPAAEAAEVVEKVRQRVKIRREAQGQTDAQERTDADQSIS